MNLTKADIGKKFKRRDREIVAFTRWDEVDPIYCVEAGNNWYTTTGNYWRNLDKSEYDLIECVEVPTHEIEVAALHSTLPPYNPKAFVTRDTGARETYGSGMVRDTAAGKTRPDLVRDGPMFLRWVGLLTRGAVKYAARNWMLATGQVEYNRFMESAARHFEIWHKWRSEGINIEDPNNPTTDPLKEDHAAAALFNINGAEYIVDKVGISKVVDDKLTNPYALAT